jgi:hypothetical protein
MLAIPRATIDRLGGEPAFAARIAAFTQALADHETSEGQPAPREIPLVEAVVKYHSGEFSIEEPEPDPSPEPDSRSVMIYAVARMSVADGDISGMDMTARLAAAFRFDVGQYWCFFAEPQADTDYFALVYDNGDVRGFVREADKFLDYFVVSTVDFTGAPADATNLSVEIKRVA